MLMFVFWVVVPYGLVADTTISEEHTATLKLDTVCFSNNIGMYLQIHTALLPRKLTSTSVKLNSYFTTKTEIGTHAHTHSPYQYGNKSKFYT